MEAHYLKNLDFSALEPFGRELEELISAGLSLPDGGESLRVLTNLMSASHFNRVHDGSLPGRVDQVVEMLEQPLNPNLKLVAAHALFRHIAWSARFNLLDRVVELTSPLLDHPSVAPLNRFIWWVRLTHCRLFMLTLDEARESASQAAALSVHFPHHPAKTTLGTFWVSLHLMSDEIARAQSAAAETLSMAAGASNFERGLSAIAEVLMALRQGRHDLALDQVNVIIDAFGRTRNTGVFSEYRIVHIHILYELGRDVEAKAQAAALRAFIAGSFLAHYEVGLTLVEAYAAMRHGDLTAADRTLGPALLRLDRTSLFPLRTLPGVLETLLSRALELRIDSDLVRRKISQWRLKPRSQMQTAWPWPIRIRALGTLELILDSADAKPIQTQRKVKDLLMMVVALGGRRVPTSTLMDEFWPDTDGDAAKSNLDVYLSRLRKCLGRGDAIVVRDGRVQLNADVCWVDVWAFEEGVEHLRTLSRGSPAWTTYASATLALYQGPLLDNTGDASWVMGPRQRLQDKFRALSGQWSAASAETAETGHRRPEISHGKGMPIDSKAAKPGKTDDHAPSSVPAKGRRRKGT